MKHLLFFILFTTLSCLCFAQGDVNLASIVKPGTQLIYTVESNEVRYHFTVTIKDVKNGAFEWAMDAPVNKRGAIGHTPKGLQDGDVLFNYFRPGITQLDDNTTSVWLSQKLAKYFNTQTGKKPIQVYANGPGKPALEMGTYSHNVPIEIKVDGVTKTLKVGVVKPLVKSGRKYVAGTGSELIRYNPDLNLPLITDLTLDFSISLQEIITK